MSNLSTDKMFIMEGNSPSSCNVLELWTQISLLWTMTRFGKIQNVGEIELSVEKELVFHLIKISYFVLIYIFPLVLVFIS